QTNKPILTITGSDPAGVSGVQADIKVISQLGGYAVSAITSVTVQNTLGIQDFHDLPASVVEGQVEAIMNDVEPQTVKIGMIRTKETLAVIVRLLSRYRPQNVIFMPVMYSAQGERLVSDELVGAIRQQLLPLCTLVVQNTQFSSHGEANMFASAVAYYLNAGYGKADALKYAQMLLDTQPTAYSGLKSRSRDLYEQFMREVEHCYKTNSDVRFYASRLNVASGYLAQVTRRIKGQSPKSIIDSRILVEAERLLSSTTQTVQEIAYSLGFTSQAYFSRFFRKQHDMSPTEYRNRKQS
ncbi:MAG: bifunctional hydroxymethylpyrimidine kinase/phosphomethylpyrimidine kinase, partial [Prevotella sp.]|nr:bifunctional hydroxymethylpyrimidine kinase/phosphomethylpyrimidine kinase [Prevotella sp.]